MKADGETITDKRPAVEGEKNASDENTRKNGGVPYSGHLFNLKKSFGNMIRQ